MTDSDHEAGRSWVPSPNYVRFRLFRWVLRNFHRRYPDLRGACHNEGVTHHDQADDVNNHHCSSNDDFNNHYDCGSDHDSGAMSLMAGLLAR